MILNVREKYPVSQRLVVRMSAGNRTRENFGAMQLGTVKPVCLLTVPFYRVSRRFAIQFVADANVIFKLFEPNRRDVPKNAQSRINIRT